TVLNKRLGVGQQGIPLCSGQIAKAIESQNRHGLSLGFCADEKKPRTRRGLRGAALLQRF
ncbi:MAG: hypothetical protein CFE49_18350, partial [Pseudomonas sp. PGPPP3]